MANEYGELEQMVNDVTSLDTARMTLRWALERLNTIEKEKADLKKGLTLAEEAAKKLQLKDASLQDAYSSRTKTLEEKEDFYTKLEATMSLLGEGKLDIQQLLKKEAKLDHLRKSLEAEYGDKFEELDRNQRAVIERWNARLLEVESQYAGKLADSQKKYDSLRAGLEADHQGRLASLEANFKAREKDLSARVRMLEDNALHAEEKVEVRRAELEAGYLAKKKELEENSRKLRSLLETGLDEKLRAMDSDHAAQVRSLEASWQTERARLLDEQKVRDGQFSAAQARIKEIENALAAQQETHHNELLKIITEKETAFRAQLAKLEKEKAAKEETVRELVSRLEKRTADWEAEKARLEAEFGGRIALMEKSLRERVASLEREYSGKKEELNNIIAVNREETKKEFNARLLAERQAMEAERSRLAAEKAAGEEVFARSEARVRELEGTLAASREEHHKELMDRIRASEAAFREKLGNFEEEKRAYNDAINGLTGELRAKNVEIMAEKQRFEADIARIAAETAAASDESIAAVRADYEARKAELAARAEALETDHAARRERFESELSARAAALNAEAETKMAFERKNWQAERARFEGQLDEISGKFRASQKEMETIGADLRGSFETERLAWAAEREEISAAFDGKMAELLAGFGKRLAEKDAELKGLLDAASAGEKDLRGSFETERLVWAAERERISAAFESRLSELRSDHEKRLTAVETSSRETAEAAAAARLAAERGKWESEAKRLAERAGESDAAAEAARAEAAGLNAALRNAEAAAGEREKAFVRELSDVKAACELANVRAADGLRARFESEVRQRDAALAAREAALRGEYESRKEELEKAFAQRTASLDNESAVKFEAERHSWQAEKARLESCVGDLTGRFAAAQEALSAASQENSRLSEKALASESALNREVTAAKAEAESAAEARLQAAVAAETSVLRKALGEIGRARLDEAEAAQKEIASLKQTIAGLKRDIQAVHGMADRLEEDSVRKRKDHQDSLIKLQQDAIAETEAKVRSAVAAVTASLAREVEEARKAAEKARTEAARVLEENAIAAEAEKNGLLAALGDSDNRLAAAGEKIAALELGIASQKDESAREMIARAAAHEAEVRKLLAEAGAKQEEAEKTCAEGMEEVRAQFEARISTLERLLKEKDLSVEGERSALAAKLSELWKLEAEVSARERQLLDEKLKSERDTEEKRHGIEREYNRKFAEVERLRTELGRTIAEYKSSRKAA